ncbi:O-antigen ligase family protein [Priestia megaterium]|uniref:O-antigen ligase family protein n=1 Tax=Priestia megaterium TaxID=1404 RepID=UPI002DBCBFB5|nr:O-antigen ligase family protein [Priestia megaterium]MEC1072267.1 hypothetical protein [Priestia megaterium]
MKYLIWPISLFIAEYFSTNFPIYYGHRIQIYIYIIFILIALTQLKGEIPKNIFNQKVIMFVGILLVIQLISMVFSYYRIDISEYNKSPNKTFIAFCSFVFSILMHYFVVRLNVREVRDIKKFLRGGWIALIISLIVCLVQLFYLFLPSIFEPFVKFFGSSLEARWGGRETDNSFYQLGSYVQTTLRVNGLTEEASNLATQFFVVFIPFLIASIKNKYNLFLGNTQNIGPLYRVLFIIIILLIMAKTTSGFLFAAITLLFLFKQFSKVQKIFAVLCLFSILLFLITINFNSVYMSNSINEFLLNKSGNSVSNRSGSTIALLKTALANPFIGVGYEYHTYYIFEYLPEWAKHNDEYFLRIKQKDYPILSDILGMFAEYGILIMFFIFGYVIKKIKALRKISNEGFKLKVKDASLIKTLTDSAKYYFIFIFISLLFSFVWFASIYLILFFFFISIIPIFRKYLNDKSKEMTSNFK